MLAPHLKLGERFGYMNYGYLWYKPYDDKEVYAAIGDSGNIIYVNMEKKISVGITGTFKPRIFDRVDFIEKKVLPVIELKHHLQKFKIEGFFDGLSAVQTAP